MAVMGVALERRAAPGAIAGRGREAAAAFRAEGSVGFRAGTVGRTSGNRETGDGRRRCADPSRLPTPASRLLSPQGDQRFGGVPGFQGVVVCIGELPGGAIELDLFQGAQGNGARTEVVFRVLPLVHDSRVPIPL